MEWSDGRGGRTTLTLGRDNKLPEICYVCGGMARSDGRTVGRTEEEDEQVDRSDGQPVLIQAGVGGVGFSHALDLMLGCLPPSLPPLKNLVKYSTISSALTACDARNCFGNNRQFVFSQLPSRICHYFSTHTLLPSCQWQMSSGNITATLDAASFHNHSLACLLRAYGKTGGKEGRKRSYLFCL